MPPETAFEDLFRRVRAGDQEAWTELIRRYGPSILRALRARLRDNTLRRLLDSGDVYQSTLRDFFVRLQSGEVDFRTPDDLIHYLTAAARNKLKSQAKKNNRLRRDHRRLQHDEAEMDGLVDPSPSPSEVAIEKELNAEVLARLPETERYFWTEYARGRTWVELAKEDGTREDALRMRIQRAIQRIKVELGL